MFAIRFTSPQGVVSYWPKGFGFSSHKYAENLTDAELFADETKAARQLQGYLYPPAFWNSERQHAQNMLDQMRGWKSEIIHASDNPVCRT